MKVNKNNNSFNFVKLNLKKDKRLNGAKYL